MKLYYEGEGPITDTVFLVGKGVTYDTGGADVKAGGVMAGMHRDKGGASAVAGFFQVHNVFGDTEMWNPNRFARYCDRTPSENS